MGHPGIASAIRESGLCLLIGTRLNVTARTGLDDALSCATTISIGSAAPYLPPAGKPWHEVFDPAGLRVRHYGDGGVRITEGERWSTRAVLAAVAERR